MKKAILERGEAFFLEVHEADSHQNIKLFSISLMSFSPSHERLSPDKKTARGVGGHGPQGNSAGPGRTARKR
jgi:hypothetical protein